MKHQLLLSCLLACGAWQTALADEIDVVYMLTTLHTGTTKEVMLTNDNVFVGPKLKGKDHLFVWGNNTYSSDQIQEIRFEKRTIDAILTVEAPTDRKGDDNAVYNLNGQKVCDISTFESQFMYLPKGIYIINGKKVIKK